MARGYVPDDSIGHATARPVYAGAALAAHGHKPRASPEAGVRHDREKFARRG